MNHFKVAILIIFGAILLMGCGITPIQRRINLPPQDISQPLTDDSMVRLILFNNSNKLLFGMDGSGKINLSLDGKGVCRLNIGEFVVVETNKGNHTIGLEHRDIFRFSSSHTTSAIEKDNYIQVYSTPVSNVAEITTKPESFESTYFAIRK